jgi:acetyl esterase
MALDRQLAALLDELASQGAAAPESLTVQQNREMADGLAALSGEGADVAKIEDMSVPVDGRSVPVRIYDPSPQGALRPVTVFFHGGGWVFGGLDSQDHIARAIASRSGSIVVSVDYRLAPEHRFPAAVDDAYGVVAWVASHAGSFGGDGGRLAVMGESAGGNLAAVVAQQARRAHGPDIALQVLAYPATDRFDDSPSMYENAAGPMLTRSWLEWFYGCYLDTPDQGADPRVSPLREPDLSGLPTAVIVTAQYDPVRDQGNRYAEALAAAGVPVTHIQVAGATHALLSFTGSVDLARSVLNDLGAAIADFFAADRQALEAR